MTARIGSGGPEDLLAYVVAPNYFTLLGIEPAVGRVFVPGDEGPAGESIAIISHSLWQRRFASDRDILDSSVIINDRRFTIAGVGPARFSGTEPLSPDVWVAAIGAAILGVLALALASLGLYAVMAYDVSHRTREIGVRMALGADARDVVRLVLAGGARLLGVGVLAGIGGAVVVGRLLRQFLFDVSAIDRLTYVLVVLFLGFVAILACCVPAQRAARIGPLDALRSL